MSTRTGDPGVARATRHRARTGYPAVGHDRRFSQVPGLIAVLVLAVSTAYAFDRSLALGIVLACLPFVPLLLAHPRIAAVLGVAVLPISADVLSGAPVRLSLPDLILAIAFLGTLTVASRHDWLALRPMLPFVAVYAVVLAVAVAAHSDTAAVVNGVQRLQIVLVPLVVGALCLQLRGLQRALSCYIVVACVVGLAFSADLLPTSLAFQKNPVGQFLVGALLVILGTQGPRWRWLAVPPLGYGLFQTESRGALLGLVLGILVLLVANIGTRRVRTALILLPVIVVLGVTYASLPDDVQQRTSTLTAGDRANGGGAQYTIRIRGAFQRDAITLIREHPGTGVGIGHYLSGDLFRGTLTADPHNVLLLEAAEGGLPMLAAFGVLILGTCVVLWRRRRDSPLAVVALAVQVSTVGHGCVDIYWVRGTPVLAWLLVGAALADAQRRSRSW
jgi:hypothetical protein